MVAIPHIAFPGRIRMQEFLACLHQAFGVSLEICENWSQGRTDG
jgi:hypothetical protein